ncbi:MAG: hypothetical protein GOV00_02460 [Candidatus Altiarchaeota archaeon]|nr:hypothetical protein [Candidatus Altiarchaeota archaeon]
MVKFKLHFHADCDGITSAYFVSRELDRLNFQYALYPSLGASVELKGSNNICLDISDVKTQSPLNFSLDHHITEKYPLFHANFRQVGFEWPVSFDSYLLFGDLSLAWVAAIGIAADWCAQKVPVKFWDTVREQWPQLKIPKKIEQLPLIKGPIGRMANMIDASVAVNKQSGAIYALRALQESETPDDFLEGKGKAEKLVTLREKILKEVATILDKEEVFDECVFLRFNSPYNIKSLVAGHAKERNPGKVIIIAQNERDKIRVSFRGGDHLDVLVKELTEGIGGGGGHPQASGGWIHHWHWEKFRDRLNKKLHCTLK